MRSSVQKVLPNAKEAVNYEVLLRVRRMKLKTPLQLYLWLINMVVKTHPAIWR